MQYFAKYITRFLSSKFPSSFHNKSNLLEKQFAIFFCSFELTATDNADNNWSFIVCNVRNYSDGKCGGVRPRKLKYEPSFRLLWYVTMFILRRPHLISYTPLFAPNLPTRSTVWRKGSWLELHTPLRVIVQWNFDIRRCWRAFLASNVRESIPLCSVCRHVASPRKQ